MLVLFPGCCVVTDGSGNLRLLPVWWSNGEFCYRWSIHAFETKNAGGNLRFIVLLMFCLQEDVILCHDAQEVDWHDLKKEEKCESTRFNFQCSLQGKKK